MLMRIYRITRNQFHAVQSMEGPKYSRGIELGMVDGIPKAEEQGKAQKIRTHCFLAHRKREILQTRSSMA